MLLGHHGPDHDDPAAFLSQLGRLVLGVGPNADTWRRGVLDKRRVAYCDWIKKNVPSTQNKRKKETKTILMITKLAGTKLLHAEDKEHGNLDMTINNLEIWKTWKEAPALLLRAMLACQMRQSQHRQDPDSSAQYWTQTGTNYTPSSVSPFLKASTCLWVKRG